MKKLIPAIVVAAAFAIPAISFAQASQQGLTRAQVRAELAELEHAGYNPATGHLDYPANIEAAEARVHEQQLASSNTSRDASGFGAPAAGTSQTGDSVAPQRPAKAGSVYFGH
ncbi:MAG: DUF4148 domain-containing protein [Paraburkholderia sp.]|uniref:DUF4148 domain-containing protein n=1 Tax=Paraburkholderia sp. TaxID=1926495 RepID=UPI00122BA13A|nr:DUF4148 domain-containing protein [Paraburkholderia sp.]TAM02958.1 MAG: DUF4148 domain-containing protein [Paraburkholderia sp.]TAM29322.1 MAG: DUF4148 domain-containing protein [Paraburkholderia sp.]